MSSSVWLIGGRYMLSSIFAWQIHCTVRCTNTLNIAIQKWGGHSSLTLSSTWSNGFWSVNVCDCLDKSAFILLLLIILLLCKQLSSIYLSKSGDLLFPTQSTLPYRSYYCGLSLFCSTNWLIYIYPGWHDSVASWKKRKNKMKNNKMMKNRTYK